MTAVCEARGLIRQIAGDAPIGTPIKSALARVAVLTGLGERRIRGLWHGEAGLAVRGSAMKGAAWLGRRGMARLGRDRQCRSRQATEYPGAGANRTGV